MQKVIVKFIKRHGVYNAGEVAGFEPRTAEGLFKAKVAEPHENGADPADGGDGPDAKKDAAKKPAKADS